MVKNVLLKVDKINVFYGQLQALHDVSISVENGEFISVVGSNGSGKTTLLSTISGLLRPQSGAIMFEGERIDMLPAHRIVERGIVQVPEGRGIFSTLTVMENLELGAYTREARKKMRESLEWVYQLFPVLKERRGQLAGTLSGGEQQMLAIARGLVGRPKLFMLDEPTTGLMPKLITQIFKVLKELNKQGITILLVEQNVNFALKLSHRAYILETGRVTLEGEGEKLLSMDEIRKAYLGI